MRYPLVLAALLATALPASADAATLFEDPAGDVGPWPAMIVGAGLPAPGDADLVGAALEDGTLTLSVASLDETPPHRLWAAGWTLDDDRYVGVGYAATEDGGGAVCVWEEAGEYGPEGEPECAEIEATVTPGAPGTFAFAVPAEFLAGGLSAPGGVVMELLEDVAEPLAFLSYTGLTMLDAAAGDDLPAPPTAEPVTTASAEGAPTPHDVPGLGAAVAMAVVATAALTLRRP